MPTFVTLRSGDDPDRTEESGTHMEIRDYVQIIRRRWRLITACFLLTVATAAAVTSLITPQYSSTTRLFVSTSTDSASEAFAGGSFSAQRVTSYADLATGQELAQRVIDALELDESPATLAAQLEANVVPQTVNLELTITDPDPKRAQTLARAYAEQMIGLVADLETPPGRTQPVLKATIVDAATLPTAPASPSWSRNLGLAAVLGLLLGFGLAVLRETLDTRVKSTDEIQDLTGSAVMGGIGFDPDVSKRPLVTELHSHAPRLEAFRVLRTNFQFVDVDASSKIIVVTSSLPEEGKSTTAVNLALTLAQAGEEVLLVDGDLRRPQVATMLGLEPSVGLTTLLVGRVSLDDAIQKHAESGLAVVASGATPPNPAELLQSHAMEEFLKAVRDRYRVVVIDAPPLLPVTDAALLAAEADGALLVVRHGHTTRDQLRGARERLAVVGARAVGVVLNMVPAGRSSQGYGYGYGYGYAPREPDQAVQGKRRSHQADAEPTAL